MHATVHKYLELYEVGICLFALREKKSHGDGERMSVNVLPHPENKESSFSPCLLETAKTAFIISALHIRHASVFSFFNNNLIFQI